MLKYQVEIQGQKLIVQAADERQCLHLKVIIPMLNIDVMQRMLRDLFDRTYQSGVFDAVNAIRRNQHA
jgi:hypothetical protein